MRKGWVRQVLGLTLATVLMSGASPASAQGGGGGGLQVSPIRLDLGPKQRGGALTLSNLSGSRKTVQVDVMSWSQHGEDESYEPTRELLANPPLFFLEPGASQVVRVGLAAVAPQAAPMERTYRVYLREVPEDRPTESSALRVAIRLGVPVFVTPGSPIASRPQWSGHIHKDGELSLTLANSGTAHLRAAQVHLLPEKGAEVLATDPTMHYVLAGAQQTWHVKPAVKLAPGAARVSALMEEGVREFPVVLQAD